MLTKNTEENKKNKKKEKEKESEKKSGGGAAAALALGATTSVVGAGAIIYTLREENAALHKNVTELRDKLRQSKDAQQSFQTVTKTVEEGKEKALKMNEELNRRNQYLETNIDKYKACAERYKKRKQEAERDLGRRTQEKNAKLEEMEKQLQEQQEQAARATKEQKTALNQEHARAKEALNQEHARAIAKLKQSHKEARDRAIKKQKEQTERFKQRMSSFEKRFKEVEAQNKREYKINADLLAQLKALQKPKNDDEEELLCEGVLMDLEERVEQIKQLKSQIEAKNADLTQLQKSKDELEDRVYTLDGKLRTQESRINQTHGELTGLKDKNRALEEMLAQSEQTLEDAKQKPTQLQKQIERLQKELQVQKKEFDELGKELERRTSKNIKAESKKRAKIDKAVEEAKADKDKEIEALKKQCQEQEVLFNQQRTQFREFYEELSDKHAALKASCDSKIDVGTLELNTLRGQVNTYKAVIETNATEKDALVAQNAGLEAQLVACNAQVETQREEQEELRTACEAQVKRLEKEYGELQKQQQKNVERLVAEALAKVKAAPVTDVAFERQIKEEERLEKEAILKKYIKKKTDVYSPNPPNAGTERRRKYDQQVTASLKRLKAQEQREYTELRARIAKKKQEHYELAAVPDKAIRKQLLELEETRAKEKESAKAEIDTLRRQLDKEREENQNIRESFDRGEQKIRKAEQDEMKALAQRLGAFVATPKAERQQETRENEIKETYRRLWFRMTNNPLELYQKVDPGSIVVAKKLLYGVAPHLISIYRALGGEDEEDLRSVQTKAVDDSFASAPGLIEDGKTKQKEEKLRKEEEEPSNKGFLGWPFS